jgi:hypothetical protein
MPQISVAFVKRPANRAVFSGGDGNMPLIPYVLARPMRAALLLK